MNRTASYEDLEVLRELSLPKSPSRKELLFKHVITENKNESILNAYKVKGGLAKNFPKPDDSYKISTSEPIIVVPEGKYTHLQGARISSLTLTRRQIQVSSKLIP
jgi:hypothetical protein